MDPPVYTEQEEENKDHYHQTNAQLSDNVAQAQNYGQFQLAPMQQNYGQYPPPPPPPPGQPGQQQDYYGQYAAAPQLQNYGQYPQSQQYDQPQYPPPFTQDFQNPQTYAASESNQSAIPFDSEAVSKADDGELQPEDFENHDAIEAQTASTPTDSMFKNEEFRSSRKVRHAFIRKVYAILILQLVITFCLIALHIYVDSLRNWVIENSWITWVYFAASFGSLIALLCAPGLARKSPINLILLFFFTLFEGAWVGCISAFYGVDEVMIAFGITCVLVVGCTLFAAQVKFDFTGAAPYLFSFVWGLMIFGFMMIFFRSRILSIVYCTIGAILFMFYIIFDTQLILGGKKHEISPEDFIFACITLYLDIINLFLFLLRLIGLFNN